MKSHLQALIIGVICYFLLMIPAALSADNNQTKFDQLHQQYLSLRNTDLQFNRLAEWHKLARDFIDLSWQQQDSVYAQRALFEGAILYQTLASRVEPERYKLKSLGLLEDLVGRFPEGQLADDALLMQGQILMQIGRESEAQHLLEHIVQHYPNSDMALVAANRLKQGTTRKTVSADDIVASSTENSRPILVLDPGHGGEDFGAVGVGGLLEKDVALDVALKAKKLIEAAGTYQVVLTRTQDKFVPLAERMVLANRLQALFFISIHANASLHKNLAGVETYYLDNKADRASEKLAERENRAANGSGAGTGNDLSLMLSDMIQNAKLPESIRLARSVQLAIMKELKSEARETPNLGVKSGPFYVLVGAHMPCILTEVAFIDHPVEGRRLGDGDFRASLARGIFEGVRQLRQ